MVINENKVSLNTATAVEYNIIAGTVNDITDNGLVNPLRIVDTIDELTIVTGAITITKSFHSIDTEADASTDDLDTINGGSVGDILFLTANNTARTIVCKDGTGNLKLAGDFSLDNIEDTIQLIFDGTNYLEISRSNNGA